MSTVTIAATAPKKHNIHIALSALFSIDFCSYICTISTKCIIVTDANVARLYGDRLYNFLNEHLVVKMIVIAAGEQYKNRASVEKIEDYMQEHNFGSSSCVLALGGGVITDMAGFVAATYHRGIKAVYVPTTLLAMTDAAIGGKTGINTAYGKNKIGTITAPDSIWLDPLLLNTLSQSQWDDGWAEIKKHAIISGEAQVYQIKHSYSKYLRQSLSTAELTEIITNSCKIKNDIVTKDPLELGARRLLNFGHTIAHGLESYFSYQISHGLAVLIGCVTEAYLAKSYFGMSKTTFIKIKELCSQNNQLLPYKINTTEFIAILRRDKKNNNNDIYCSLMLGLGVCYNQSDFIAAVNKEQITVAIEYLNNNYTTF